MIDYREIRLSTYTTEYNAGAATARTYLATTTTKYRHQPADFRARAIREVIRQESNRMRSAKDPAEVSYCQGEVQTLIRHCETNGIAWTS